MSRREVLRKLVELENREQALTLCRFISNLFRLFDSHPPHPVLVHLCHLLQALEIGDCPH